MRAFSEMPVLLGVMHSPYGSINCIRFEGYDLSPEGTPESDVLLLLVRHHRLIVKEPPSPASVNKEIKTETVHALASLCDQRFPGFTNLIQFFFQGSQPILTLFEFCNIAATQGLFFLG